MIPLRLGKSSHLWASNDLRRQSRNLSFISLIVDANTVSGSAVSLNFQEHSEQVHTSCSGMEITIISRIHGFPEELGTSIGAGTVLLSPGIKLRAESNV